MDRDGERLGELAKINDYTSKGKKTPFGNI